MPAPTASPLHPHRGPPPPAATSPAAQPYSSPTPGPKNSAPVPQPRRAGPRGSVRVTVRPQGVGRVVDVGAAAQHEHGLSRHCGERGRARRHKVCHSQWAVGGAGGNSPSGKLPSSTAPASVSGRAGSASCIAQAHRVKRVAELGYELGASAASRARGWQQVHRVRREAARGEQARSLA